MGQKIAHDYYRSLSPLRYDTGWRDDEKFRGVLLLLMLLLPFDFFVESGAEDIRGLGMIPVLDAGFRETTTTVWGVCQKPSLGTPG